jgi:K+-transporting ATPase A subunit
MSNSSVDLIDLIKRIIAPLFLLFGVILVVSGVLNAISVNEIHTLSNEVIITYPKLLVGSIMSIGGLVIAILSYLIFHGKIKLQKIMTP